jgi:hypothetical protein
MTAAGPAPQSPDVLRAQLLASVAAVNPGYTILPGVLIEDISSTDVYATLLCDQAQVELINSLTPLGANPFLLLQLGEIYGTKQGVATNGSVNVVFSGSSGFPIPPGFTVSDGVYNYVVRDGGLINSSGSTIPLYCYATQSGIWAIPAGTVTNIVTSVPSGYIVTCINPLPGTPATDTETTDSWRARTLQAGLANSTGAPRYLKTLVGALGVDQRLIGVQQQPSGGWKVLVAGGDSAAVAYAIWRAVPDVSTLVGSVLQVSGITNANPGVITTALNHNYATGQVVMVAGATGMVAINGIPLTITVLDEKTFSTGIDTTGLGTYTGSGVLFPNLRNVVQPIIDYPDVYEVTYVNAPQQLVNVTVTWNTTTLNYVNAPAIAQYGAPAIAQYVNTVPVGQPINMLQMGAAFEQAISNILAPALLTRLVFAVSINGVGTAPITGSQIIEGDTESYFYTDPTGLDITVSRG